MSHTMSQPAEPSLRNRQREMTRRLLIDAFAEVILRDGIHGISMQTVADEAGCSLRTLYRHYPSREALLTGLDDEMRAFIASCFDRLPPAADEDFVVFVEQLTLLIVERRDLVKAWVTADLASPVRDVISGRVRGLLDAAISDAAPSLSPIERARAFAGIRLVVNSRSWIALTDHMSAADAAATAAWIVRTLLADLASGGGPKAE